LSQQQRTDFFKIIGVQTTENGSDVNPHAEIFQMISSKDPGELVTRS
jgi:hypothetical protein